MSFERLKYIQEILWSHCFLFEICSIQHLTADSIVAMCFYTLYFEYVFIHLNRLYLFIEWKIVINGQIVQYQDSILSRSKFMIGFYFNSTTITKTTKFIDYVNISRFHSTATKIFMKYISLLLKFVDF